MKSLDLKLEIVVIPVSNVDRAEQFYEKLGWRLDADFAAGWGKGVRAYYRHPDEKRRV